MSVKLDGDGKAYFLFGVSAKHLRDEVSTTVSQNETTGSATFISVMSEIHIYKYKYTVTLQINI